jgi:hypothetical protein
MVDMHHNTVQPAMNLELKDHGLSEHKEGIQTVQPTQVATLDQEEELEPELHARTWIALAAFFLLNFTQVASLQGPTAVVSTLESGMNSFTLSADHLF